MIDDRRHKAIFSSTFFEHPVHVIGCGGMGSRVVEGLVRMGVGLKDQSPLHLYDDDGFDHHNVANQWIDLSNVGGLKAEEIVRNCKLLNKDCDVFSHCVEVREYIPLAGVVFVCVDSMIARREIMENVIEQNPQVKCVIETRMDAESGISHCFDPHDSHQNECWWLYWHTDEEADNIGGCREPQSIISAIYGTTMLALKQFEQFARMGDTIQMSNRVYMDFAKFTTIHEQWSYLTE